MIREFNVRDKVILLEIPLIKKGKVIGVKTYKGEKVLYHIRLDDKSLAWASPINIWHEKDIDKVESEVEEIMADIAHNIKKVRGN